MKEWDVGFKGKKGGHAKKHGRLSVSLIHNGLTGFCLLYCFGYLADCLLLRVNKEEVLSLIAFIDKVF